jgi:uncharacterized membrane protein YqgA involved in biofilm formation
VSTRSLITDALGFVTLLAAADATKSLWSTSFSSQLPRGWTILGTLFALVLGSVVGAALHIQERLENFGEKLRLKFRGDEKSFLGGFMAATLLFAIGPLAILGSVSDGMGTGITQLALKSTLDFFSSIAFASTFGIGVIASIIPVGLYQGLWTLVGALLGQTMDQYQIDAMTVTGGVLLFGISLRLLNLKEVRVGDMLPALFFAPLIALAAHQFV